MEEMLYTVKETAGILKCNATYVYKLIGKGLLPALKLGSMKVRKKALEKFLAECEGKDLTNLENITTLTITEGSE
jgi:excisionase family DNA binding protein